MSNRRQPVASNDNDATAMKRQNPCVNKGFGDVCHRVSHGDLVLNQAYAEEGF